MCVSDPGCSIWLSGPHQHEYSVLTLSRSSTVTQSRELGGKASTLTPNDCSLETRTGNSCMYMHQNLDRGARY
jgi:hypothetical protein